jgi:hypothetical protein
MDSISGTPIPVTPYTIQDFVSNNTPVVLMDNGDSDSPHGWSIPTKKAHKTRSVGKPIPSSSTPPKLQAVLVFPLPHLDSTTKVECAREQTVQRSAPLFSQIDTPLWIQTNLIFTCMGNLHPFQSFHALKDGMTTARKIRQMQRIAAQPTPIITLAHTRDPTTTTCRPVITMQKLLKSPMTIWTPMMGTIPTPPATARNGQRILRAALHTALLHSLI